MKTDGDKGYWFETERAAMVALRTKSVEGIVYRTTAGLWSWALVGSWVGLACEYLWSRKVPTVDVTDLQGKVLYTIEHAWLVRSWDQTPSSGREAETM